MTEFLGKGRANEVDWLDFIYRYELVGNMASILVTRELREQVASIDEGLLVSLAEKAEARLDRLNHRRQSVGLPNITSEQLVNDAITKLTQDKNYISADGVDQRVNVEEG